MTLNEWQEWKHLPQTIEWFKYLRNLRELAKEEWAQAMYVSELSDESLQRNAAALGEVNLLKELIEATYESLEEVKDELE